MQFFRVILYKIHFHKVQHLYHGKTWKIKLLITFLRNYLYFKKLVHKFAAEHDGKLLRNLIIANHLFTPFYGFINILSWNKSLLTKIN